jgi:hypothetical protein
LWPFCHFYFPLICFTALGHIFPRFGVFSPVLVCCTQKNLAALVTPSQSIHHCCPNARDGGAAGPTRDAGKFTSYYWKKEAGLPDFFSLYWDQCDLSPLFATCGKVLGNLVNISPPYH